MVDASGQDFSVLPAEARIRLIETLKSAYSGELGAALAYDGHARSLRDPREREQVREIGRQEWEHRRAVGTMLRRLGAEPDRRRECLMRVIGRTISVFCRLSGWLAPMYGAGWLESGNVREYEEGARFAAILGHREDADSLLAMAEVEWDHERFFRGKVQSHWLSPLIPIWGRLPEKRQIRRGFDAFLRARIGVELRSSRSSPAVPIRRRGLSAASAPARSLERVSG